MDKKVSICNSKFRYCINAKSFEYLLGEHDFHLSGAQDANLRQPLEVEDIKVIKDNIITIEIQANAFLLLMVRIIVGTLLMVAKRN